MRLNILVILSAAYLCLAQDRNLQTVKQTFDAANIPTDLGAPFNPSVLLEVTFPENDTAPITLHAGLQVPRNETAGPPTFAFAGNVGSGPFVVAMVDLDAPSPTDHSNSQVRHFLGGNFRPSASSVGAVEGLQVHALTNSTPAVSEFKQPTPTSGIHR
ncbi:hypothetical protein K435DRAFT_870675 [Dendrothele bispora CBS 962.96]|uniref:PEBP-like protein n=1 Tax=Dendrothele bispora (strain CBS 962.96) TaxID=1314807 RepID=A0A4S8L6F1_DENBC|nr:hypothetical protein K435DRAFT_870675 [Dendrothele bispora CBS 962.96]